MLSSTAQYSPLEHSNLQLFYAKIFPAQTLIQWLSKDNSPKPHLLSKREFSFTLSGGVYTRFLSFTTADEFCERLKSQLPVKIDIGAIYSARPTERKSLASAQFRPLEKELVFDIDMTDYDDVRNCCSDKKICRKCWKFIHVAVKIIDQSLQDDFGFEHRLWVFSGRRGIHCWVSDQKACKLTPAARKAIVSFLDLKRGGVEVKKKLQIPASSLNPSLRRSLDTVEAHFPDIMLNDQDFLNDNKSRKTFLDALPEDMKVKLLRLWDRDSGSLSSEKWSDFQECFKDSNATRNAMSPLEFQAYFLYPRLDSNVSVQLNHLLKSPFCVHPETGKICVPLKASDVENFDPENCPTLENILQEFKCTEDIYETALGPYIRIFDEHVGALISATMEMKDELFF